MAISWGSEVKNSSGNGMRLGYEFSQSPSSVGAGTSSVTVTLRIYFWSRASISDSTNSLSITGNFSWSGDVSISHGGRGGTTLVRTLTRTVSPSYSGTTKSSFSASISGINAISGTARVSGTHTTAKRPVSLPDAPTGATVTRDSDTRQYLAWTRTDPTTASKPYEAQELQRWDRASDVYRTIANLSGGAANYTDSSTKSDTQYRYRIRAKNSAGASDWAYTDYMATSPAPPTSVRAQKSSGDIRVTWTNTPGARITGVEIWLVQDGVLGSAVHVLLPGNPTSWTHTAPDPTKTWAYRLKTQTGADANDAAPNLYSALSVPSNTVQLLTNPAAPSRLSPGSTALDAVEDIAFTWQHNDVDSTDQTAYELRYRKLGTSTWTTTGKVTSPVSERLIPADTFTNGDVIEWQVRTWGEYAVEPSYSPWSATAVITFSARPAATILSPGPEVISSRVAAEWAFFDEEDSTQTAYRVRLEDELGTVVYSNTVNGSATSTTLPVIVADGATYTFYLSVRDGDGVWSVEASQVFVVDYADPVSPIIEPTWDVELGAVVVLIEHPEPGPEEVAASSCKVWRSDGNSDWVLIADDVPPSTAVTDYLPALDTVNYYRVTTVSDLPSSIDSPAIPVVTKSEGWIYLNGDSQVSGSFSTVARVRYNPSVSTESSRDRVRHHFAGRSRPVEFTGEAENLKINLSAELLDDGASKEDMEALAKFPPPLCYRDGTGRRVFVSVDNVSISNKAGWHTVSLTLEQIDHHE